MIENYSELTVGNRITLMLNRLNKNQTQLSKEIGISKNAISNYVNDNRVPDTITCYKISKALGVPMEWILKGDTPLFELVPTISEDEVELIDDYRQLPDNQKVEIATRTKVYAELQRALKEAAKIPDKEKKLAALREYKILNLEQVYVEAKVFELPASAGSGEYIDGESPYDMVTYDKNAMPAGADFGIRITGDSMEPLINDGDIVWIKKQPTVDNNDLGIFIVDNEAFCKKLELDHKTKTVRLISLNQVYEPMIIDENRSFTIVGKVIL